MAGTGLNSGDVAGTNTVKFLCSYAGKILPRYPDGKLRYVGGETRVLAVDRTVPFKELLVKLGELCGEATVSLRCQLPTEDLDALVSVTSDEDLKNLIEEYDRISRERAAPLKIRAVLSLKPKPPLAVMNTPEAGKTLKAAGGRSIPAVADRSVHQIPPPVRFPSRFMLPVHKSAGTPVAVKPAVQYYARFTQGNPRNSYLVHNGNHWQ